MVISFGRLASVALLVAVQFAAVAPAVAADTPMTPEERSAAFRALPWVSGPTKSAVGQGAMLALPKDYMILPEANGSRFLELTGNLPEAGNTILVHGNWWATLEFAKVGYVKDDEKLDPDELLKTLKSNDEASNVERKKRGIAQLHTDGWVVTPHYDPETKYLEWGVRLVTDEPQPRVNVNYTVRMLGRSGYESVILVTAPETLQNDVRELKATLKQFNFNSGEKYSEFKPGDHVAEIGLGALVLGGIAAAGAKTGFWKLALGVLAASWKLVAGAVVVFFGAIGKMFGRKKVQ